MDHLLDETAHRQYPLPRRPWLMSQRWQDLLFIHWPVPVEALRPLVPAAFAIDTYDDQAWLAIVPFRVTRATLRNVVMPVGSRFPELNVRTYVIHDDKPGLLFFSLDAASPVAAAGARTLFHLPYFVADMRVRNDGERVIYRSLRTGGAHPAVFRASYRPTGPPAVAEPGSLADWLTMRLCLYTTDSAERAWRADIHHLPWRLQPAELTIEHNTMAPVGVPLPDLPPLLHFSERSDVLVWAPVRL